MSLKTLLVSTLLAATAIATDHGSGGSSGGDNGWSSWSSGGSPGLAAASCPAGCFPTSCGGAPPAATQAGQLIVQVVSVSDANGSLKYFPDNVQAPVGSIVQFQYHPKNHTITESSFAEPCKPVAANLSTPTRPGLRSGFVPVTGQEPFTPVFNVLINDTKPIWIFCGQTNHCQKGMAMVINQNATSGKTIEAYISAAAQLPLTSTAAASSSTAAAAASSASFSFGGSAPQAPSSSVAAPAVATVTAATSSVAVAPATFTGAAVHGYVPRASTGVVGLIFGALLAL